LADRVTVELPFIRYPHDLSAVARCSFDLDRTGRELEVLKLTVGSGPSQDGRATSLRQQQVPEYAQLAETGDGRYFVTLTGIARFKIVEEIAAVTPYRQCRADFSPFSVDFSPRAGEDQVDRDGVLRTLRDFAETNHLQIDWNSIHDAPNEALVNALSMMSPCSPKEKQALLEACDLKGRADVLVAITEIELARGRSASTPLH
jgi:hypothetical protein